MPIEYGFKQGLTAPAFGKRTTPPVLPAYVCWAPLLGDAHKSILRAPDSFQARKEFAAAHCGMQVIDVCARRLP